MKLLLATISILFASQTMAQQNVYVNYVSHNEDNYASYVSNPAFYLQARTMLRQFAIDCKIKGAKWSMGNDFMMLDAVATHDVGGALTNTDGLNLLKWMQDSMDVELDAHAHAQTGNPSQADVAYKHTLLGTVPSSVISGYLLEQADGNNNWWFDYENPVPSNINPAYFYEPEILWGGAYPGHSGDPEYYGVWKPMDTLNLLVHDASKRMINYGSGCRIKITDTTTVADALDAIDGLLDGIQSGDLPSDGFYPISLFIAEYHFWDVANTFNGDFLAKVNEITDSINVRVSQGAMQWMHIEDIIDEWKVGYSSTPFYASCDQQEIIGLDEEETERQHFSVFPIPSSENVTVTSEHQEESFDIQISTLSGQSVYRKEDILGKHSFSVKLFPSGTYLLTIVTDQERQVKRFVVN